MIAIAATGQRKVVTGSARDGAWASSAPTATQNNIAAPGAHRPGEIRLCSAKPATPQPSATREALVARAAEASSRGASSNTPPASTAAGKTTSRTITPQLAVA